MTHKLHPTPPRTVVVADDDPAWRLLVRSLLEPHGFQLVEACDGVDALRAVQTYAPLVLVLDLKMPRLGGAEVCQHLRAVRAHPRPGIIVMTATDLADLPTGAAIGADKLLTKPFDPAKLLAAVEALAARRREFSDTDLAA